VIPSVIVFAAIAAVWLRWWAVPVLAVLWSRAIGLTVDADAWLGALLLGAANATVGAAFTAAVVIATRRVPVSRPPSR
jgi:hypothetical protein